MKQTLCQLFLLSLCLSGFGQGKPKPVVPQPVLPPHPHLAWHPVARDWGSTEWEAVEAVTNALSGEFIEQETHRYTELGDGLNYQDAFGRWFPSKDLIEITTNGAAAVRGPTKVYFGPNLNAEGAITIISRTNNVLRLRPLGLYYYDAQSGESVPIATVRDCEGELLPPNRVVYHSVLDSLQADLVYIWTRGSFESDLVLLEKPQPPDAYGLNNRTTRLELWHVFDGDPQPQRIPVVLEGETDPDLRSRMAEPDLVDETLDFGDLQFPRGYAFSLSGSENANTNAVFHRPQLPQEGQPGHVPVAKRLVRIGDRTGLVESVPWHQVRSQLDALPSRHRGASLSSPGTRPASGRFLPALKEAASQARKPMKLASAPYRSRGFCLDYYTVSGSSDYTFSANNTYYVESSVTFNGIVKFYADTVIKFASGASLTLAGMVSCIGPGGPTILTSKDENIFGQTIAGSTGNPGYSAGIALSLYWNPYSVTLSNLRIRWANRAIGISSSGGTYTLSGSALEYCNTGVTVYGSTLNIQNSTQCSVNFPLSYNAANATVTGSLSGACAATLGEAVDEPGWLFTTGGNATWNFESTTTRSGGDAAQSGDIDDKQVSYLQTTLVGPGTLSFWWKVSSEAGYDFLRFNLDAVEQTHIAGAVDWTQLSYFIPSGTHTLQWNYTKDGSLSGGADAGWVDNIQFSPGSGSLPIGEAVDNTSIPWATGGDSQWFGQTTVFTSGGDAAQSGDVGDSQSSYLQAGVSGPCTLSFYWRVSSEQGWDFLNFKDR